MSDVIVMAYALGWALTSVGLVCASHRLKSDWPPAHVVVAVSLVAGAAWPLLLLGVVQYGVLVVTIRNRAVGSQEAAAPDAAELVSDAV